MMANRSSPKTIAISVSVVIATYNRAHYLPQALDSLLHQTRPPMRSSSWMMVRLMKLQKLRVGGGGQYERTSICVVAVDMGFDLFDEMRTLWSDQFPVRGAK